MRVPTRLFAAAVLAGAALSTATPANAACVGTAGTVVVCAGVNQGGLPSVNPTGSSYNDCIYAGPGACRPISVPIPTVTPGQGNIVYLGCGGDIGVYILDCSSPI